MARSAHRRGIALSRLLGAALIALALSPGLLWRDDGTSPQGPATLAIRPLPLPPAGVRLAPGVVLAAGWQIASRSEVFGSYSSLVPLPDGELLAISDRGHFLRFARPGSRRVTPTMGSVGAADDRDKRQFDIESATRDPKSGTIWLGYEGRNAILRFDPALKTFSEVQPAAMASWPSNRGPEALVRLADGRFVVLSEALGGWRRRYAEGLLFAGDPLDGGEPEVFRFVPPPGFRPTDMAQLPDGRVAILLRKIVFALPPRLDSRVVVADPATIAAGKEWAWQGLAEIGRPLPTENYEGLAVEPRADGTVRLWLISDDNNAAIQRTLLLALDWTPQANKKARGIAARPSGQPH